MMISLNTLKSLVDQFNFWYEKQGFTIVSVFSKDDLSPVTNVDLSISNWLIKELPKIKDIPVISEETELENWDQRKAWESFWIIDPIDGTKGFIEGSGEWTVNVAYVEKGIVQAGLVICPALQCTYLGAVGEGTYYWTPTLIRPLDYKKKPVNFRSRFGLEVVGSVHHPEEELKALMNQYPSANLKSRGSSLKFCLVADGQADYYPRYRNLMEWDIAAAHGVLKAAGGNVYELGTKKEVTYNSVTLKAPKFEAY